MDQLDYEFFNHSLFQLFSLVPKKKEINYNVTFGCRSIYNGVLMLRSASHRKPILRLPRDHYHKRDQDTEQCSTVSVLFIAEDLMGPYNNTFRPPPGIKFAAMRYKSTENIKQNKRDCVAINIGIGDPRYLKINVTSDWLNYSGGALLRTVSSFKDNWKYKYFRERYTKKRQFWVCPHKCEMLPMMSSRPNTPVVGLHKLLSPEFNCVYYMMKYNADDSLIIRMNYHVSDYIQLYEDIIYLTERERFDTLFEEINKEETLVHCRGIIMPRISHETSIDLSTKLHEKYDDEDDDKVELVKKIVDYDEKMPFYGPIAMTNMFKEMQPRYKHILKSNININETGTNIWSTFDTIINPVNKEQKKEEVEEVIDNEVEEEMSEDNTELPTWDIINKPFTYFIVQKTGAIVHMGIFTGRNT